MASIHVRMEDGLTHCHPVARGSPNSHCPSLCVSGAMTHPWPPVKGLGPGTFPSPWTHDGPPLLVGLVHPGPPGAGSDGERFPVGRPRPPGRHTGPYPRTGPPGGGGGPHPRAPGTPGWAPSGRPGPWRRRTWCSCSTRGQSPPRRTRPRPVRAGPGTGPGGARPPGTLRPCHPDARDHHGPPGPPSPRADYAPDGQGEWPAIAGGGGRASDGGATAREGCACVRPGCQWQSR